MNASKMFTVFALVWMIAFALLVVMGLDVFALVSFGMMFTIGWLALIFHDV